MSLSTETRGATPRQGNVAPITETRVQDTISNDRLKEKSMVIANQTKLAISEAFPEYAASLGAVTRSGSKRWRMVCPLPEHDDRNPSFTIFESRRGGYLAKCSCGFAGDAVALAQRLEHGLNYRTAVERIAAAIGLEVELVEDTPENRAQRLQAAQSKPQEAALPPIPSLPAWFEDRHRAARARLYQSRELQERAAAILGAGITPELIREMTFTSDALGWANGKLVYLYEHGAKVRNPEGAETRFHWMIGNAAFPWRWHFAARPEVVEVFLCESESDAVALIAAGLEQLYPKKGQPASAVIAIPGAGNFAAGWARLFAGKRVTLCFDWDGKSDTYREKTASLLTKHASRVATINPAKQ